MSERIRGRYDDALYKSTYTLLYTTLHSLGHNVYLCFSVKGKGRILIERYLHSKSP